MGLTTIASVTNPNCGYLKQFAHVVDLHNNGVPSTYIEWCDANCQFKWGWHFWQNEKAKQMMKMPWDDEWVPPSEVIEGTRAFMSFESYDEMILFKFANIRG